MKYMHFRASCSYTALAILLEKEGIQTEDYKIALEMNLPWLFSKENDSYVAGPMLQGAKWFDLWLSPRGFLMSEVFIHKQDLSAYLLEHTPAMLGIRIESGKHAVVFTGYDGKYHFLNPVHENSTEPTELTLSIEELLDCVDDVIVVGTLTRTEPKAVDYNSLLRKSASVLSNCLSDIGAYSRIVHDPSEYPVMMDRLFRALLLDGISMLELAGESTLAKGFTDVQKQFIAFMKSSRSGLISDFVSMDKLFDLTRNYIGLIENKL